MVKKSVIEKADEAIGTINDEFDLTIPEMSEIQDTYGGSIDAICASFRYGYAQGTKATKELKKNARKTRMNERKESIISAISKIRRGGDIEMIYQVAQILLRLTKNQHTDRDINIFIILMEILNYDMSDKDIDMTRSFVSGYAAARRKAVADGKN